MLRNDAGRLASAFDPKDMERASYSLIYGVWGDVELSGDFFRREMLVDEEQAIKLARAKPRYARSCFLPRRA